VQLKANILVSFSLNVKLKTRYADGGSFINVISSYLMHSLSLSPWRLPIPHYMQWTVQFHH
jgi:hypothetical protein